jgi:hypothetical protein
MSSRLTPAALFKVMAGLTTAVFVFLVLSVLVPPAVNAAHDGT